MKLKIKFPSYNFIWLLPFLGFICGYFFARICLNAKNLPVPKIIGLPVTQALFTLSSQKLNLHIIAEKEDLDLPEGTIISQKPSPHQSVKPHQAIFVVLSKKPELKKAPNLLGKNINQVKKELQSKGIKYKEFALPLNTPLHKTSAQYPAPTKPLNEAIRLFKSLDKEQKFIFPNLKECRWEDVKSFLERHDIHPTITYKNKKPKASYTIIEQRPLPGTLISLKEPIHVQLHLSTN